MVVDAHTSVARLASCCGVDHAALMGFSALSGCRLEAESSILISVTFSCELLGCGAPALVSLSAS